MELSRNYLTDARFLRFSETFIVLFAYLIWLLGYILNILNRAPTTGDYTNNNRIMTIKIKNASWNNTTKNLGRCSSDKT